MLRHPESRASNDDAARVFRQAGRFTSLLRAPGLLRGLGRVLPELLGLLGQSLRLRPDELRLEAHHFLNVLGADQLLGELERARDVLLGERHGLAAYVLGSGLSRRGVTAQRPDRL